MGQQQGIGTTCARGQVVSYNGANDHEIATIIGEWDGSSPSPIIKLATLPTLDHLDDDEPLFGLYRLEIAYVWDAGRQRYTPTPALVARVRDFAGEDGVEVVVDGESAVAPSSNQ